MAEYRYYDGALCAGYYCMNCGQSSSMLGHLSGAGFRCERNEQLVKLLNRANPPSGVKPHYVWSPRTPRMSA